VDYEQVIDCKCPFCGKELGVVIVVKSRAECDEEDKVGDEDTRDVSPSQENSFDEVQA